MKRNKLIAKWKQQDTDSSHTESKSSQSKAYRSDRRSKISENSLSREHQINRQKKGNSGQYSKGNSSQHSKGNSGQHSKSTAGNNVASSADKMDIPGFYYDTEKRKYFRIQPNHNSSSSSTVTRETIQRKEKEQLRLKEISCSKPCKKQKLTTCETGYKKSSDLPHLLNGICTGSISNKQLDSLFAFKRISNITSAPAKCQNLASLNQNVYRKCEHLQKIVVGEKSDCILGLWSTKEIGNYCIQLLDIKREKRLNVQSRLSINMEAPDLSFLLAWDKVTNVCWADLRHNSSTHQVRHVLYTTMSLTWTGNDMSMARICQFPTTTDRSRNSIYDLGHKCVWTCAWNTKGQNFSVGSEKCGLLLDVETRRLWELNTNNSDPLVQVFDTKTRYCLYTGTRNNQILCHDLRSISTHPTTSMSQSCSICSLQLLQDNSKLLASDVQGHVCIWDLRMRKVVQRYIGLKNQYRCIPIHTDDRERFVYGTDSDGYVRFWCLRTGSLVRTIPPPSSLAQDFIPTVAYSDRWAGEEGNAGLVIGLGDKFYLYPSMDADISTSQPTDIPL